MWQRGVRLTPLAALALIFGSPADLVGTAWRQQSEAMTLASGTPDSVAILRSIYDAQAQFEAVRRNYLRQARRELSRPCDEQIGRYCYWDEEDESWKPTPEAQRVRDERNHLIGLLDSAAAVLPGDPWVAGQRVRYLVESARLDDALQAARECGAARWWCRALAGFVLHERSDFAAADSAFAFSIASMTGTERCRWSDLSLLLENKLARHYRRSSCDYADPMSRRIWWLADPLYLTPGNERRTEHYTRMVVDHFSTGSANIYGPVWDYDNYELVVRYGRTVGWERSRNESVIGHHDDRGRRFVPPAEFVLEPLRFDRDGWELDPNQPRERYALRYLNEFHELEHQLAVFQRGDSAIVVGAFDWREVGRASSIVETGLFVSHDALVRPTLVQQVLSGKVARLALSTPKEPSLVSLEVIDRADSVAGRARYWVDLARGVGSFDLLLLDADPPLPRTLRGAIAAARGSVRYRPGDPIHIYWEIPLAMAGSPPQVALTVKQKGTRAPSVTLAWEEMVVEQAAGVGRSVTVSMPQDARGRYTIRMEVRTATGDHAVAEKEIVVQGEGDRGR